MTAFEGVNRVTSPHGYREVWVRGKLQREVHRGHDIVPTRFAGEVVSESAWNVREVTGGVVLRIAYDKSRGNYIDVTTQKGVFERYQHLAKILVQVGQKVAQGAVIAVAGNTGNSTARHLHFGVYRGGSAERNAIEPSAWDGLPNKAGIYSGNNTVDGAATPPVPPPAQANR
ncbi:MAG: M23 family metallopeptidase [Ruthenibacterium sp.]